ncbi:MAG: 1-deoxy-D-xylulose-5-phosphate synthase [Calditrichota bacterium]
MSKTDGFRFLPTIDDPADVRSLRIEDLEILAQELRQFIIETVSNTGGHLGSNLGAVELAIALHYVYDTPRDLIVWDVGAQAYPHKILTGRRKRFHTNRQYGGIAGFPRRDESIYDTFGVGHSSTSISAALGMAVARDLRGEKHKVIAVIGDGAMTGGMAYEGLNNAGIGEHDLTVILNDNSMAISPNVGALKGYLSAIRTNPRFEKLKDTMWQLTGRLPRGSQLRKALHGMDAGLREMLIPGLWFERLGFRYVGPIDGHNLPEMIRMFHWLKTLTGPVVIHLLTVKGKGYLPAENDPLCLHGVNKFDPDVGPVTVNGSALTFSEHFSSELCALAEKDPTIVAITPAMIEGSALNEFQARFPNRCFDVGIAEQHALTFAAGLATQGIKPVVAIYSTFLQRAFDQLVHDIALQNLPVVLGVDRAGLVGEDGPTHHGAFDLSYLRHIPSLRALAARDGAQLRAMLRAALTIKDGPVAVRFPRGKPPKFPLALSKDEDVWKPQTLRDGKDGLIIGVGPILADLLIVADKLQKENKVSLEVVDLRCLKPLPEEPLRELAHRHCRWLTVEENALEGGAGSALIEFLADRGLDVTVCRKGLPDRFITHGDRASLLREIGLDVESLCQTARDFFIFPRKIIRHPKRAGALI